MATTVVGMSTVGAKLYINGTTPATGTQIAEAFNITGPSLSQTAVDTTHHTSSDRFRTYAPAMADGGEITFDVRYVPSAPTHDTTATTGLVGLFGATGTSTFVLEFPDNGPITNSYFACVGILTQFTPRADLDSSLDASGTIKLSGKPTFADAT